MEDYKRFFRYIIPGLVFIIEVSVYLLLSAFDKFSCLLKNNLDNLKDGIGIAVTAFLLSGGIGYLLGVFYHTLFHIARDKKDWDRKKILKFVRHLLLAVLKIADHLTLIKDAAEKKKWLKLENRKNGVVIPVDRLTQAGAWRIATVFLNTRWVSSKRIKSAKQRLESYGDIMHGAGATFIGSVIAFIVWAYLQYKLFGKYPSWWFWIFSLFIIIAHMLNYRHIVQDYQGVSNIIIANELQEEWRKNRKKNRKKPVIIHIAEDDL